MKWGRQTFSFFDICFIFITLTSIGFLLVFPFLNYNNQALFYFFQKKYGIAEQKWLSALSQNSFSPFYRMNLALNYILLTQSDKAIQEYEVTRNLMKEKVPSQIFQIQKEKNQSTSHIKEQKRDSSKQDETQSHKINDILFYTFFNSAISASQKGEPVQALDFYQKALGLRPHSREVKTNIELLVQNAPTPQQQDDQKKEESDSSKKNEDHQEDHQQGAKKEGAEEQENRKKDKSEDFDKKSEEQAKTENKEEMQKGQEERDKKKEQQNSGGEAQDKKEKDPLDFSKDRNNSSKRQQLDQRQTEAILKAILDQENKIRERRHQEEGRPSPIEKDW
ncbi:MAG: hypothetical protein OXM55_08135 [Bdellovibrionales bacterium]|nr:hypothetical protein [Bdellovibrionales bacterium]